MNRRQALAAIGAWTAFPAISATNADYRGDIAILREALRLHPGLYRYATPSQIDRRIARLERDYVAAATIEQRYLTLSRFLATIRCGHTYCNFYNQSDDVAAALFDRNSRLPFHFDWIEGRMIVVADPDGVGLAPGSEVLTVNGVRAAEMLATLLPYARADGHNDAKRVALLGVTGSDRIEFFDVFHGLIYGVPPNETHRLVLRRPQGTIHATQVPAIGLAARQAQMTARDYSGEKPAWSWTMQDDGIATLTMPSWALYESKWDWRQWLSERLDSLHGAKGLIVDIRQNEGGEDCGDALLARLAEKPILDPGAERRVRFVRTPAALNPYLHTWDKSFRTLGVGAQPIGNGFLRLTGDHAEEVIAPVAPRITLPVAALIGPVNSSATFQFAQKAKRSRLVRLFGERTGGNQRGINGGCFFFVQLPASGIEFDLPLIGYFPEGNPPDTGLAPDVHVQRSAADLAAGRDGARAAAAAWILRGSA
ncbi:S41 family peptidase [Sphingomonas crusticola]|uniref:S41 family peptidase n=1 Tax=Sphingomonas crusticola TaxID=1697973 RepID=UPI000E23AEC7|nr:S41 family peptidase [Sphingomonas crusticola]